MAERQSDREPPSRSRWVARGFGLGLVFGFLVTGTQVARAGFHLLPNLLVWNLIWAPWLGAVMGLGLSRRGRRGPLRWGRPQLRTRTLMAAVAYVALLLGMVASTRQLGDLARRYHHKFVTSAEFARVYRELATKSEADAALRRENVAGLRAGGIPEGLHPGQRDFLRSLEEDAKVTPEHREYRRDLILEAEEGHRVRQERNVWVLRDLGEYYRKLAAKYDRARWRPWHAVEPDPPVPK